MEKFANSSKSTYNKYSLTDEQIELLYELHCDDISREYKNMRIKGYFIKDLNKTNLDHYAKIANQYYRGYLKQSSIDLNQMIIDRIIESFK